MDTDTHTHTHTQTRARGGRPQIACARQRWADHCTDTGCGACHSYHVQGLAGGQGAMARRGVDAGEMGGHMQAATCFAANAGVAHERLGNQFSELIDGQCINTYSRALLLGRAVPLPRPALAE